MIRRIILGLAALLVAPALAQAPSEPVKPNPWFPVPHGAVFMTGDTWTFSGETHRLYGVQACIRGTHFTNGADAKVDCGEASLSMLVSLVRDLKPMCYTSGWRADTKTRFLVCIAQPSQGAAPGSRIDLGTALISSGWAFAAINPDGQAVHVPYMVAQAVAQRQKAGLWQFPDTPDPNTIILNQLRAASPIEPRIPQPTPPR